MPCNASCVASLLVVSAALFPVALDAAECKPVYKTNSQGVVHTACKPKNDKCKITASGLTDAKKAEFLKAHNDFRMKVAKGELPSFPKAAAMLTLAWDDELANVAQALADQCTKSNGALEHDKPEERFTAKYKSVGQNVEWDGASATTPDVEVTTAVTEWFDGYKKFKVADLKKFATQAEKVAEHFTQVIWAATESVGCGFTQYTLDGDTNDKRFQKLYVCNYGPA
ncbi:unnamed protein product [Ixodes hexagonus]